MHTTSSSVDGLAAQIPAIFDARVLNVALWKWIALLTLVVVAYALSSVAAALRASLDYPPDGAAVARAR